MQREREGGDIFGGFSTCGEVNAPPPPLEALMSNSLLLKESLLKDPNEEVIFALGAMYEKEASKGVQEFLKDATPFKMTTSVSIFFYLFLTISTFCSLPDIAIAVVEHVWHLYGEVL